MSYDKTIYQEEITLFGRISCDWCLSVENPLYRVQVPRGPFYKTENVCQKCLLELPKREENNE